MMVAPKMSNTECTETIVLTSSDAPGKAQAATLFVISGPGTGKQLNLGASSAVAGRQASCELYIESPSVSRQHARFDFDGSAFVVQDLASKNGTFVNGDRVSQHRLADGDLVKLGKAVLKFVQGTSAEARYLASLSEIATTDPLTGVANRRRFDEALDSEIGKADAKAACFALILIDVDHFKGVNDQYGHLTGDRVLQVVGSVLREQIRDSDFVARVGGEEFAVLCSGTSERGARILAERIRVAIETAVVVVEDRRVCVTASLGVAVREGGSLLDAKQLYQLADERLYAAKNGGRNRVIPEPSVPPRATSDSPRTPP
jgi:diguanylate cyclase (GGDEF)-like protein